MNSKEFELLLFLNGFKHRNVGIYNRHYRKELETIHTVLGTNDYVVQVYYSADLGTGKIKTYMNVEKFIKEVLNE